MDLPENFQTELRADIGPYQGQQLVLGNCIQSDEGEIRNRFPHVPLFLSRQGQGTENKNKSKQQACTTPAATIARIVRIGVDVCCHVRVSSWSAQYEYFQLNPMLLSERNRFSGWVGVNVHSSRKKGVTHSKFSSPSVLMLLELVSSSTF